LRPYLALFVGVLAVSFAAVFIRLAEAPPLAIAAYRMAIAAALLLPFTSVKAIRSLLKLSRRDLSLVLLSGMFLALHFWLWITSLSYTSIASSVVLVTAHPAFVVIVSYFLWRERLHRAAFGGIAIAFTGVILISYGGLTFDSQAYLGNLLALTAGLVMGAYLITGRQLRARIDIVSYLTAIYTIAAIALLIAVVVSGTSLFGYSAETYTMLVLLALVPQLIGHSSLNLAVRLIPVTLVSVAILGEPVGATILGALIIGEVPMINELIGGALILGGIYIVIRQGFGRDSARHKLT
jgi:drug/metabolite transporter (DMT)-like permease